MKATLDFERKTIELDGEPTLEEIREFQQNIQNWREWRIVTKMAKLEWVPPILPTYPVYPSPVNPWYVPTRQWDSTGVEWNAHLVDAYNNADRSVFEGN